MAKLERPSVLCAKAPKGADSALWIGQAEKRFCVRMQGAGKSVLIPPISGFTRRHADNVLEPEQVHHRWPQVTWSEKKSVG